MMIFPARCCACDQSTRECWNVIHGLRVPMCGGCRTRWSAFRVLAILLAVLMAVGIVGGVMWRSLHGHTPTLRFWIATVSLGVLAVSVAVVWGRVGFARFLSPARVVRYHGDPMLYVRFTREAYHQSAKRLVRPPGGVLASLIDGGGFVPGGAPLTFAVDDEELAAHG